MLKWFVETYGDAIIRSAQKRPYFHLEGYMERWWFFRTPFLRARVHHILRSDRDRHLHDHPWWYISIILKGSYTEVMPLRFADEPPELQGEDYRHGDMLQRDTYGPGSIRFRRGSTFHRLEVQPGESVWTLFIIGPKRRDWGFMTEIGKIGWKDYFRKFPEQAGTVSDPEVSSRSKSSSTP